MYESVLYPPPDQKKIKTEGRHTGFISPMISFLNHLRNELSLTRCNINLVSDRNQSVFLKLKINKEYKSTDDLLINR